MKSRWTSAAAGKTGNRLIATGEGGDNGDRYRSTS